MPLRNHDNSPNISSKRHFTKWLKEPSKKQNKAAELMEKENDATTGRYREDYREDSYCGVFLVKELTTL